MHEIGVDIPDMPTGEPTETIRNDRTLHLLYVGRFIYWKGMHIGLRAISNLSARGIPVHLTMIGKGPNECRWKLLAAQLGLAQNVTWVPWMKQQDLFRAYQTFDALLFPSLHDSGGTVVLEAMAGGLPVVCLDLGGPAELVNDRCGRVIPVENLRFHEIVDALADTLAELAADPKLITRLRIGASRRAQEFTWQRVIAQVWGEYGTGLKAVTEHTSSHTGLRNSLPKGSRHR